MHQIRKMVGLSIAIMRGFASKEILETAFKMERVDIPIAPSLNLLLEEVMKDNVTTMCTVCAELILCST